MPARKKAGPSRMDKRREADAAEAREKEVEEVDDEDEDEDEEDDDEEAADDEADAGDDDEDGGDDDDEDAPKKKKKKLVPKKKEVVKKAPAKRTRTPKEVRLRATWVVFDNGSKRVGVFQYSEKKQAEKFLAQKIEEKKATFYIQLVKEPFEEEKKEEEKEKEKKSKK